MVQGGKLCSIVFAGEWKTVPGSCSASPPETRRDGNYFKDSPYHRWSFKSEAEATPTGGFSRVWAWAIVDTKDTFPFYEETKETAKPPQAWAKGELKKWHGLPSHARGIKLGTYRAFAKIELSFSAQCTAAGPTASVVGGGSTNAVCAMGEPVTYSISQLNIGCDTKASKEWGVNATLPNGLGLGFTAYESQVGRYDSGPQTFPYFYKITDKDTTSDMLQFNWNCDAQARITAFAKPGWFGSSQSEGTVSLESKVSDVSIEVDHAPTDP
jgi:hypothetical protein